MKVRQTGKKYFYFKLEKDDYQKYGYDRCRKFINAMQKEIPAGNRYWIKKAGLWAIKKENYEIFKRLINQYLTGIQKEIFE